ncbi:MAG: glycosyltransferase [Klebsiella sp.]|uniref:glycosyltransferase n=1 Tax=Klebsiella TaxID=570 RepID=UPI000C7DA001|nr:MULTISPECIES: glycosyltransferase [Klebsiella]MDU7526684.1 glycosyltransferase [Klebsiella sp.]QLS19370.1 glycosyltransferase [Klebsiella michiganensis]
MKKIVLSGVNMTEGGILTIYKNVISILRTDCKIQVYCLVHDKKLFEEFIGLENFHFLEFPSIKSSWFKRIWFEFVTSETIRKELQPDVWFCLHDITARVKVTKQYVYCHNPSPFYQAKLSDFFIDKKFFLFTKFYRFLYAINIKKNNAVVVQQRWIADSFHSFYKINNIIVSRPVNKAHEQNDCPDDNDKKNKGFTLIYPAIPRVFKNMEVLIDAMDILKKEHPDIYKSCKILLTFSKGHNKYGDYIIDICKRKSIENISFIGFKSHSEIKKILSNECDGVIFPSKLETWGLPLTEAMDAEQNLLAADLPYAKETIGTYKKVAYFSPDDSHELMTLLLNFALGTAHVNGASKEQNVSNTSNNKWKVLQDWNELKELILMD